MNKIFQTLIKNPKSLIIGLIIVTSIFLISLLFPKEEIFDFEFSKGQNWEHSDVIAANDFYVWKTKTELDLEKEEKRAQFRPIFQKIDDKSAFYDSWKVQLSAHQEQINEDDYQSLSNKIESFRGREILLSNDLNFDNIKYDKIRLINGSEFIELRSTDYISYEALQSELSALISLSPQSISTEMKTVELNNELSQEKLNSSLSEILAYKRKVKMGESVIKRGEIISSSSYDALWSLQQDSKNISYRSTIVFIGFLLLTCLIIGVYIFFLLFHYSDFFTSTSKIGFLLLLIVVMSFLVYSIESTDNLSSYLIPFCIVPIVVKSFFSDRLALFTHIVVVLIASFLSVLDYEFTFLQILAGIVAVLVIEDTKSWNKFFISILSILAAYFIGYLGLCLINYQPQVPIDWSVFKWLTISGVLTLLAYPFIPLLAKIFGFVSSITLSDLADLSQPLLKELSINAPGTLQHSLQVANLSEAAAEEIGANGLLLKVGSLYHDIGKLHNPSIFIENQKGMNPHENLTNFESARAIIDHVIVGIKMAKKAGLPEPILDLIKTHHGTTRVEYFYRNQLNQFPDKQFDESLFQYPGPKPRSREESILMIADSLEAASKSLKNPTGKDIDDLVDKIVSYKISNEQFSESNLSFEELDKCVKVFKSLLRNINHVRIEYPEVAKEEE